MNSVVQKSRNSQRRADARRTGNSTGKGTVAGQHPASVAQRQLSEVLNSGPGVQSLVQLQESLAQSPSVAAQTEMTEALQAKSASHLGLSAADGTGPVQMMPNWARLTLGGVGGGLAAAAVAGTAPAWLGAAGAVGAGYAMYDYWTGGSGERLNDPEEEARLSREYHVSRGLLTEEAGRTPYQTRERYYRQTNVEPVTVSADLSTGDDGRSRYQARDVTVESLQVSKNRQITGDHSSVSEQDHHLFAHAALVSSLGAFSGSVASLIEKIRRLIAGAGELPGQTGRFNLLRGDGDALDQTLRNMEHEELPLSFWQRQIPRLVSTYVQLQQASIHAVSQFGSGAQSEGTHLETLRLLEDKARGAGDLSASDQAKARERLQKMFDLSDQNRDEYNRFARDEGTEWLAVQFPTLFEILGL